MSGAAIEIQGLSKQFRLYHEKYTSLKERILHAGHMPYEEFWALRDVSAEIPAGQTVGILGRNGSGKSTLLKCAVGIIQPTTGRVVVRGQLAAMLELGAGFEPELSGRDNIYLNGSLLGLSRREIARRFDDIVAFAELEQFIDNQVKYYSSGMYVRLGFAVAVNVDPDVLVVDEVLAVGDERFQQKCLNRVLEFQREGRTIVVVSHSPEMFRQICDQVIVLDRGELVTVAPPGEAIRTFRDRLMDAGIVPPALEEEADESATPIELHPPQRQIEIDGVSLEFPGVGERSYLVTGEPLKINVAYRVLAPIAGARFSIVVLSGRGEPVYGALGEFLAEMDVLDVGTGSLTFVFDAIPLLDGRYEVNIDVRDSGGVVLAMADPCHFEVMYPGKVTGVVSLPLRVEVQAPGALREPVERFLA